MTISRNLNNLCRFPPAVTLDQQGIIVYFTSKRYVQHAGQKSSLGQFEHGYQP